MSSANRAQNNCPEVHDSSLVAPFPDVADGPSTSSSKGSSPSSSTRQSSESEHNKGLSATDLEAHGADTNAVPLYSIFTLNQKRGIVAMAAMGGFFSAISANIYFPALNPLAREFHVSPTLINLTITGYQIFQGIAPLMVGDLADMAGRRPAYILCFVIYIAANVGLALCPNYTMLFIFRCLQSSGSSGTIALGSGVVADVADASERGVWMGFNTAGSNIAPALGPVVGGLLAEYLGWRSIFWFLTIIAGVYLTTFGTFFPETSRNVVGNGSVPPSGLNMSLMRYLQTRKSQKTSESDADTPQVPNKRPLRFPNPLNGLRLLKEKDIGILLVINALLFSLWYCTLSTTPYLFDKIYHFDQLKIGLCYLPLGVGALCAPVANGNALDWNFRRTAAKLGMKIDRKRATNLKEFPIERCRLEIIVPFMFTTIFCNFIYGWVMHFDAPLPAALVLQFVIGFCNTSAFGGMNVLLVDLFPSGPSTVIATNNLCRCFVAAAATATVIPLVEALGTGGAFSLFGGILLLSTSLFLVLVKRGPEWRSERRERLDRAKEEKEEKEREAWSKEEQISSSASSIVEKKP